jgi:hypothetical protein
LVNQPRWLGGETTRARSEVVKGETSTTHSARQIDASTCCEMFGKEMCSQFERNVRRYDELCKSCAELISVQKS